MRDLIPQSYTYTCNIHTMKVALSVLVIALGTDHVLSAVVGDRDGKALGDIEGHGGGHVGDHYDERPDPFHFEYGVHDDKYHTDFSEQRSADESGNMKGEYTVALPDGRIQHVIYHADGGYGGTIMEVSYSGEAHHPDYHAGGHGGHV